MRKIKFRAWRHDGEYSHMIESPIGVYTAIKHCLGVATPAGFSDIDNQPKKDGYTLMQWTGLKDRNGKEIYEGDIVKYRLDGYGYKYTTLQVEYLTQEAGFYLTGYNKEGKKIAGISILNANVSCEVIGNVYEHPELL